MKTAFLSLGSNLGDRERNLQRAVELLAKSGVHVKNRSSLYETEPQDLRTQPWFLNLVLEVETRLFPLQLLGRIHKIEAELGRKRVVQKGPRTIDIDIILFGNFKIETAALQIPHPRFPNRRFVLEPLLEIAPELRHPATRLSVREMLTKTSQQAVKRRPAS